MFRDQNFEPSSTKQFEQVNPESIIDLQLQKGLRARRENPSLENPMHFSLKFGLGENYVRACVFSVLGHLRFWMDMFKAFKYGMGLKILILKHVRKL